jgi:hypothetical protein
MRFTERSRVVYTLVDAPVHFPLRSLPALFSGMAYLDATRLALALDLASALPEALSMTLVALREAPPAERVELACLLGRWQNGVDLLRAQPVPDWLPFARATARLLDPVGVEARAILAALLVQGSISDAQHAADLAAQLHWSSYERGLWLPWVTMLTTANPHAFDVLTPLDAVAGRRILPLLRDAPGGPRGALFFPLVATQASTEVGETLTRELLELPAAEAETLAWQLPRLRRFCSPTSILDVFRALRDLTPEARHDIVEALAGGKALHGIFEANPAMAAVITALGEARDGQARLALLRDIVQVASVSSLRPAQVHALRAMTDAERADLVEAWRVLRGRVDDLYDYSLLKLLLDVPPSNRLAFACRAAGKTFHEALEDFSDCASLSRTVAGGDSSEEA